MCMGPGQSCEGGKTSALHFIPSSTVLMFSLYHLLILKNHVSLAYRRAPPLGVRAPERKDALYSDRTLSHSDYGAFTAHREIPSIAG